MRRQKTPKEGAKADNRKQKTENRVRRGKKILQTVFVCVLCSVFCALSTTFASDKWPGVDESVIEKFAKEHGREAREPFINTDQGDLLLFVFLLAGTVGGFAAGYNWRKLMENRSQSRDKSKI